MGEALSALLSQAITLVLILVAFATLVGGRRGATAVLGCLFAPFKSFLQAVTRFALLVLVGCLVLEQLLPARRPTPPPPSAPQSTAIRPTPKAPAPLFRPIEPMTPYSAFGGWLSPGDDGAYHVGIDLDAAPEQVVRAIADGTVLYSGTSFSGFGDLGTGAAGPAVLVRHHYQGRAFTAVYGHALPLKSAGVEVVAGEVVGTIWPHTTYNGTPAVHLHLGIWDSENPIPRNGWGWRARVESFVEPLAFLEELR